MITKFGKRFLTTCIAGMQSFNRQSIAIGIGSTTPSTNGNDTRLGFEFYRLPVSFGGIDIQTTSANITAASWSSNLVTFTANNTFISGQSVSVSGSSNASYNITGNVINPTSTTFQIVLTTNPGSFTGTATAAGSAYSVIYKTTIPQDVAGTINEIGLYPSSRTSVNNYDSKFLSDFEDNLIWFDSLGGNPSLVNSPTPRIGGSLVGVTCTASTTKEYKTSTSVSDISGYSGNDTVTLAINQADLNLDYIHVRFYSSDTAYHQVAFDGTDIDTGTGNKILSRSLSTATSVNSPGNLISKISIVVAAKSSGTTNVYFDGLRINDEDTFDASFGLIARSTITPISKIYGRPLDLEYKLGINF